MQSHLTPCGAACRKAWQSRFPVMASLAVVLLGLLVFVLATSATCLANPFEELPPGHWAYSALAELVRYGVLDYVPAGDGAAVRCLTRYEISLMVAKALSRVLGGPGEAAGAEAADAPSSVASGPELGAVVMPSEPPQGVLDLLARLESEFRPELRLLVGGATGVSELARAANNVTDIHELRSLVEQRNRGTVTDRVRGATDADSLPHAWTGGFTVGEALVLGASYARVPRGEAGALMFGGGSAWGLADAGAVTGVSGGAGQAPGTGSGTGAVGAALRLADGVWLQGWYSQDSLEDGAESRSVGLRTSVDLGWMNLNAGASLLLSDPAQGSARDAATASGKASGGRMVVRAVADEPDEGYGQALPVVPGVEPGRFTFDVSTKVKLSDLVSVGAKYDRTQTGSVASTTTGIDVSVRADKGAEINLGHQVTESTTDPSSQTASVRELVTSFSLRYPFTGDAALNASYSSANVSGGESLGDPLELREKASVGLDFSPLFLTRAVLTAGLSYETVRDFIASTVVSTRTASTGLDYSLSEGRRLYAGYSVSDSGPSGTTTTASLGFGYMLADWAQLSIGYKMVDFLTTTEEQDRVNMATAELSIRF